MGCFVNVKKIANFCIDCYMSLYKIYESKNNLDVKSKQVSDIVLKDYIYFFI